jgi:hypothetical protein
MGGVFGVPADAGLTNLDCGTNSWEVNSARADGGDRLDLPAGHGPRKRLRLEE